MIPEGEDRLCGVIEILTFHDHLPPIVVILTTNGHDFSLDRRERTHRVEQFRLYRDRRTDGDRSRVYKRRHEQDHTIVLHANHDFAWPDYLSRILINARHGAA